MLKLAKRLFEFHYLSPLAYEMCKEQFTPEYREKLRRDKKYAEDGWSSWYTYLFPHKKGRVLVYSNWGRLSFTYRFTLEKYGDYTILHCSHNPLGIPALFLPLLLAVIVFVGIIISAIDFLSSPTRSSLEFVIAFILVFAAIIGFSSLLEYSARTAVDRLTKQLVYAVPVIAEKKSQGAIVSMRCVCGSKSYLNYRYCEVCGRELIPPPPPTTSL